MCWVNNAVIVPLIHEFDDLAIIIRVFHKRAVLLPVVVIFLK